MTLAASLRRFAPGLACAATLALFGCAELGLGTADPAEAPAVQAPAPPAPEPSALSLALADYYARTARQLLADGMLRTDGGGRDAPFTARMLADNFTQIALYDEYVATGGRFVAQAAPSRLRRWETPITLRVEFGASVPEATRLRDRGEIARYTARLAGLTGVPIRPTDGDANFDILIVNEDERQALGPRLRALVPGISTAAIGTITDLPRSTYCIVFAFSQGNTPTYRQAVAVIRAELPDLLRTSCIHEELAQAMGLANDSPSARPSIFNDDEEFALLTRHDELLLRILYDARLRPGMTVAEARPIVEVIAADLLGGPS